MQSKLYIMVQFLSAHPVESGWLIGFTTNKVVYLKVKVH